MGEITGNSRDLPSGTLRVDLEEMRKWSTSAREIANSFVAASHSIEGTVTDGYVALSEWDSGPALRARWIRWEDQITSLGNLLADVADRLNRTADNYRAADEAAHRQVTAAPQGW
ncbi:WXG100 family type VII secretion target [Kitasatospora phosalacinea]|uniref:WXG100 family type VII secretion target n=1 Tax=Kitasatospora phosalacinea TaxID=2065 RepID=UPI0009DF7906|nr:type VII secretion target [Kitasatospora phosalacinea]